MPDQKIVESIDNPVFAGQQPRKSILKTVLMVVGVLVIIGAISASAYFGYNYYKSSQVTLGGAVINTIDAFSNNKINSGEVSLAINFTAQNVGQNYSDLATDAASRQITGQLKDVAIDLSYAGVISKKADGKFETSGDLNASVKNPTGGSLGVFGPQELGLSYKTFFDNIYINIQKLPAIASTFIPKTIDTAKYLNQWYSLPTNVADQYSKTYASGFSTTTLTTEVKNQIFSLFDTSGAFTVTDKKSEKTDKGTSVTAMYVKVDWDKLGDELVKLSQDTAVKNNTTFTKSQELELRANIEKFKEVPVSNSVVRVLVGDDGYIHGYAISGDLMDKSNNKVGSFSLSFTADSFNQSFTIERPADARPFAEVIAEINGLMGPSINNIIPSKPINY